MNGDRWRQLEEVFFQAIELPAGDRLEFVAQTCEDAGMRAELRRMLQAHEGGLEMEIEGQLMVGEDALGQLAVGTKIGPYRTIELIGEGGMGAVYLAERADDQYEHRVAIKLLRPGFHSASELHRFKLERQILARLDHPNIATLLDGGVDASQRPYLVMQFVKGEPITDYCDRLRLTIDQRLELFEQACRAVAFAHQNLVVHRDLKPGNILVTEDGVVKLLDFGIAKLLRSEGVDREQEPLETAAGDRLYTRFYASPEQKSGGSVTTATDVYALGVLLHLLLTGNLPVEEKTTSRRPSQVVTDKGDETGPETLETRCRKRQTSSKELRRVLRGDLDTIVGVAMREEPTRRYASASSLLNDVSRYREGLWVTARGDSAAYLASKFVARNKLAVAALLALVVSSALFAAFSAFQARTISKERDVARLEKQKVDSVLEVLLNMLGTADPASGPGGDRIPVEDLLQRVGRRIGELGDHPEVQGQLRFELGEIYRQRGQDVSARPLLEEAHQQAVMNQGATSVAALEAQHSLALVLGRSGNVKAARQLLEQEIRLRQEAMDGEDPGLRRARAALASTLPPREGIQLLLGCQEHLARVNPEPSEELAGLLDSLGVLYQEVGDRTAAAQSFRESIAIMRVIHPEEHPSVYKVMSHLAAVTENRVEAVATFRRLIALGVRLWGESSTQVATAWNDFGVHLAHQDKPAEAEKAFRKSVELWQGEFGDQHPMVFNGLRNVGRSLELQERYAEAVAVLDQALEIAQDLPDVPPRISYYLKGQREMARFRTDPALDIRPRLRQIESGLRRNSLGEKDWYVADSLIWRGAVALQLDDFEDAHASYDAALSLRTQQLEADDPKLDEAKCGVAITLLALEPRSAKARDLLAECSSNYLQWGLADPWLLRGVQREVGR